MLRAYAFVLAVIDLDRSAAYYRDVLGFRMILWEDATDWRLAERDGVRLCSGISRTINRLQRFSPTTGSATWKPKTWRRYVLNLSDAMRNVRNGKISRTVCGRSSLRRSMLRGTASISVRRRLHLDPDHDVGAITDRQDTNPNPAPSNPRRVDRRVDTGA